MNTSRCALLVIGVVLAGYAKANPAEQALAALKKAHPEITWNEKSEVSADVNCDGKPEVIVLGSEKDQVVVAVVPSENSEKQQLLRFPTRSSTQDAFCAIPTKIHLSPLDCDSDEGPLSGCKPTKRCKEFTVVDDECDPFNFYWDASRKKLAWWRN